ncbi:MAG: hypothetical protein QM728_10650 [Gordonia sp. (in: high G+C Gram-positive bacteria)]|uniref:hypothetical protein n=1 Tax=Gordonia sp. (in: high G+C Gram-positive bacteria) TaxID=84139 RepID=UPI0039E484AC
MAALVGTLVAGCAVREPTPSAPRPHFEIPVDNCSVQQISVQADALVATGLRDAGYRRVVVDSCASSPARDAAARALGARGIELETTTPERAYEVRVIPAVDQPERVRRSMTRAVMVAEQIVAWGEPGIVPPDVRAVLANPTVLALAGDDRVSVGGRVPARAVRAEPAVGEPAEVWSRAIGRKGLIVSLHNPRTTPATVTVSTGALGLAGQIRGIDAWTGREYSSSSGWLGGEVGAGDTLLIQIV